MRPKGANKTLKTHGSIRMMLEGLASDITSTQLRGTYLVLDFGNDTIQLYVMEICRGAKFQMHQLARVGNLESEAKTFFCNNVLKMFARHVATLISRTATLDQSSRCVSIS